MPQAQETKNEHTVPQGYLKKFTYDGKRLYVFDKSTGRWNSRSTKSVASLPNFYDFPEDIQMEFGDPQLVEHVFSDLEPIFYKLRDEVLKSVDEKGSITDEQKVGLSYFMALQYLRTNEHRRKLAEMLNRLESEAAKLLPDGVERTYEYLDMFDEHNISLSHAGTMFPPDMLYSHAQVLCNHIWTIGMNETSFPLYTSDAPVVMYAHSAPRYSARDKGLGLGSPGVEIAFPLTPQCILILWERTAFRNRVKLDRTTESLTAERVKHYNRLQTWRSFQYVCSSTSDFSIAEKMCERFPDVCYPDRMRLRLHSIRTSQQESIVHVVWFDPDRPEHEVH